MNNNHGDSQTETILSRIATGDTSAVEDCIRKYGNLVRSLARKFTPRYEDSEDAVQDVFVAIWQNASRYDSQKAAETTFISTIARRRLIDRLRKVYRRPQMQSIEDVLEIQPNNFEDLVNMRIEAARAVAVMRNLSRVQREMIVLNVYEGMSHGEIGERTGIPLGTVKTHIRRGFNRVREVIGTNLVTNAKVATG